MGLTEGLEFSTKREVAADLLAQAFAGGVAPDFIAGDEVYGNCTALWSHLQECGQVYYCVSAATCWWRWPVARR